MRRFAALFLLACGCHSSIPEPAASPEQPPVDDRPWCEQAGYDWATLPETEPEPATPAVAVLGFASIDKDMFRRVIREDMDALEACYEQALAYNPNLMGRLVVRFAILPEGQVDAIEVVDDTLDDPCVGRCVIAAGRERWQFPPRSWGGEITILYPFSFEPH